VRIVRKIKTGLCPYIEENNMRDICPETDTTKCVFCIHPAMCYMGERTPWNKQAPPGRILRLEREEEREKKYRDKYLSLHQT